MINKIIIFLFVIMIVGCSTQQQPIVRTTKPPYKKPTAVVVNTPKKPVYTKNESTAKPSTTKPTTTNQNTNQNSQSEILEATTRVKVTTAMVLDYISKYKDVAKSNMKQYGIPSSIILGQGILESGAGTGPLSSLANNHFGIKCHKEWTGPSVKYDDDSAQECFRKYELPSESYKDHALFLTSRAWYLPLFDLEKDDYKQWAIGLKKAGYATDPKYPEKLIGIIERYQLSKYDSEVLGTEYIPINTKDQISLKSDLYQVSQGDTLYSISKKFNLTIEDLKKKNNIGENTISIGQNLIIK
ncbi:glucosaminidase domain-containing protein [Flavobacterium luteum]|uniref:Peptidoglycan hydrolase n=1 Tax=Flavobacterium luteum TaxID=2026654 RepID=A0A7J5AG48_9FLAO|nr:glucosaminidase domain-containing protein [Flavobacterium luteum]KAB1156597.1 LysM peptidoglycan-binding domain-containing protein [Flavobacterium luteum]